MNELEISLTGKIKDTNFDEWKADLLKQIAGSKRDLKTEDDFALAESDVKTLKAGEKSLKLAKQSALEQAAEIQKLFAAIDEVSEEARQARLTLERQIKKRKEEIRDEIVDSGMQEIDDYLAAQSDTFRSVNREQLMTRDALEDFTKGKRSPSSMEKAIDKAVAGVKSNIDAKAQAISANDEKLNAIDEQYSSLFQDKHALLGQSPADLDSTIADRIEYYKEEQAKLREAEQKEQAKEDDAPVEEPASEEPPEEPVEQKTAVIAPSLETQFTISIEVFADEADAAEFMDELEVRFSHRDIVGEIAINPA